MCDLGEWNHGGTLALRRTKGKAGVGTPPPYHPREALLGLRILARITKGTYRKSLFRLPPNARANCSGMKPYAEIYVIREGLQHAVNSGK